MTLLKSKISSVTGVVCKTLTTVKMLSRLFSSTTPSDMCIRVLLGHQQTHIDFRVKGYHNSLRRPCLCVVFGFKQLISCFKDCVLRCLRTGREPAAVLQVGGHLFHSLESEKGDDSSE